ncbi:MAG: hypothetical protein R3F37_00335 [Candidatus Competibacteraceae bacterium]
MPAYEPSKSPIGIFRWFMIIAFVCAAGYFIWNTPWILGAIPILVVVGHFQQKRTKKKFIALQEERKEEGICEFARSFKRHAIDTWVIRAVYEQIQEYVAQSRVLVPLRASDNLVELLEIDSEDLDMDLVEEIAQRTKRSLKNMDQNPFTGKIQTLGDLVYFFNAQPVEKCTNRN